MKIEVAGATIDWTVPDANGILHVPDHLDKLFNQMGTYLRFHTMSEQNEALTIAQMTRAAEEYAKTKCVYLVIFQWSNGGTQICGCFDSREKAERYSGYDRTNCIIQEIPVG